MFEYIIIALLSVLTIIFALSTEKEKRNKLDLIIELENSKETFNSLYREYNTKSSFTSERIKQLVDSELALSNRLDDAYNERNHYKNKVDSLTKEINSSKGKLVAQIKVSKTLFEENSKALLKIAQLEEQLLFTNTKSTDVTEPEPEQVPDLEAEQVTVAESQGTVVNTEARVLKVRKPHRPRARGSKQAR